MYTNLSAYYQSLFAISMTMAGVAIAGFIALAQVLQGLFAFRAGRKVFSGRIFWAFVVAISVNIALTGLPALVLSYLKHDFIKFIDLNSANVLASPVYAILTLFSLLISVALFLMLIYREGKYIVPAEALSFFEANIIELELSKYLKSRYATPPYFPAQAVMTRYFVEDSDDDTEDKKEFTDEDAKAALGKYEKSVEEYERARKRVEVYDNPLSPIESALIAAVQQANIPNLLRVLATFERIIESTSGKTQLLLIRYYTECMRNCMDISLAASSSAVLGYLMDSSHRLFEGLIDSHGLNRASEILTLWKDTADRTRGIMPQIFKQIMEFYRGTGEVLARSETYEWEDVNSKLEDIFRDLGWLGERLLSASAPETKPIMYDNRFQTELDALMNGLLAFGYEYQTKHPDKYPLIYYDALYVIARRLSPYYDITKESAENSEIKNTLFSLMFEHQSIGEAAIRAGNASGAALAAIKLQSFIRLAEENNQAEQHKEVMISLLRLGVLAAAYEDKLDPKTTHLIYNGSLAEDIKKTIVEKAKPNELRHEARELLIKSISDMPYEKIKAYLKSIGDDLGTTFGMNLD